MTKNSELFERASALIPGGVNSPVRAFGAVGGTPPFIARGKGAYLFDADGKRYIDYVGSWGPMILGHLHPAVVEAVEQAVSEGFSFGAPTEREIELAAAICELMPSVEMVRMTSSGTEAAMSAVRLARGVTARDKFIKFEGCYHGHADALLVKGGSGMATFGHPNSAGVPAGAVKDTIVLEYNNLSQLEEAFILHGADLACVIVEAIGGNMNFVRSEMPFLKRMRELCTQYGALLIIDEVMTGFRVALGGAQELYAHGIEGFRADITVFGKVIGGGMPLAAFGGSRELMEHLAPTGPVYQAGTLSGNPIATAAGLATLREVRKPEFHERLAQTSQSFIEGLQTIGKEAGIPLVGDWEGGLFGFFFRDALPQRYADVLTGDKERFNRFFHYMLDHGVYLAPSMFEAGFTSAAITPEDVAHTLEIAREAIRA